MDAETDGHGSPSGGPWLLHLSELPGSHWEDRMAKSKAELAVVNGQFAHATTFTGKKRIRHSFGRIPEAVQMPNLIEVQRASLRGPERTSRCRNCS